MTVAQKVITLKDRMSDENIENAVDTLARLAISDPSDHIYLSLAYFRMNWSSDFLKLASNKINDYCLNILGIDIDARKKLGEYVLAQNELQPITEELIKLKLLGLTERQIKIRELIKNVSPEKIKIAINSVGLLNYTETMDSVGIFEYTEATKSVGAIKLRKIVGYSSEFESEKIMDYISEFHRINAISEKLIDLYGKPLTEMQVKAASIRLIHGLEDFKIAWESIENIDPVLKKVIVLKGIVDGDIPKATFSKAPKPFTKLDQHRTEKITL
jgi:hypothetical protein